MEPYSIILISILIFMFGAVIYNIQKHKNILEQKDSEINALKEQIKMVEVKLLESGKISSVAHLSAGILHQISQPITAINGFIKFLKKEMDHEHVFYRPVCLIDEQCVYLKQMLEDMMELVRHRELKRANMNVNDAVYKAMNLLKDELRIRRINWDLDLQEQAPQVFADSIQLQQIFMNIVVNAMQAMSDIPKDKEKYIRITSRYWPDKKEIMISFQDTGPGISKDAADHVFEPFYSTKSKGVGIGLALCQTLIQEQGGRIKIEDAVPTGANFIIHLPVVG